MDNTLIIVVLLAIFAGVLGTAFYIYKKLNELNKISTDDKSLLLIQQQINQISEQINTNNSENLKTFQEQFKSTAGIVKDVTEKLTVLEGTNKQVVGIADQLQGLENVLKNPKQRGILGEYYLETLLENLFPPDQYKLQYSFSSGEIVDAVLFIKNKILPIDSKFSLENYNKILEEKDPSIIEQLQKTFKQDLKNRIDETAKYIKPKDGTMEFAFMFIPSEAIYYDLLVNKIGSMQVSNRSLLEYACKEKRVIIVSPTSFAAYLQTVLQGLNALKIEESIREVIKNVNKLDNHLQNYETYMQKLGSNLGTTVNMYNNAYKEFNKVEKDVTRVTGKVLDTELLQLDKPKEYSEI